MTGKSWGVGSIGVSTYGPDDNWNGAGPPAGTPPADQGQGQAPPPPPPSQPSGPSGCVGPGSYPGLEATCCPGLTTTQSGGNPAYQSADGNWWGGDAGTTYCNAPPAPPCAPPGKPPAKATLPYQADGGCCPPSTNQGGVCKLPAGVIAGTYKTQYMAAGATSGGANFAAQLQCNSNSGCNGGWTSAGRKESCNDSHGPFRDWHHSNAHLWCAPPDPKSFCPTNIGTVVSGAWYGAGGGAQEGACGGGNTCDLRLQCTYSRVTNPFDTQTIAAFTGVGASDLTSPNGIQKMYCDTLPYASIGSGSPCAGFYTGTTKDYDYQQALRINEEKSDGSWATDTNLFQLIASIAQGSSSVTSPLGKQTAQAMILNYCLTQKPNDWPSNQTIRTQINQWALQNALGIGDDCQLLAADIIAVFCSMNTTSTFCDCFNATNFGANIFTACQGKTITACADIAKLTKSFAKAPPFFAPQIATLKSYITPKCAVGACTDVVTSASAPYLAPDTFNNLKCESNIQFCMASVKVEGSVMPGATIDQSCQTSIGITATVPTSAGGSAGCPSAGSPPPTVTPTGLQNVQVVEENANSPSGPTIAVVASQPGTSTAVQTTGAPGGGLTQNIQASAPVQTESSGGPVTQNVTITPTPTIPTPTPTTPTTPTTPRPTQTDNTQKNALIVGGSVLGLLGSFMFLIFIGVVALILFSGGKKTPAAPKPIPLSAYGL